MINALILMIAVLPKMLRAKMAANYAPALAAFDHPDSCLSDQINFIRNNNCPIPAANDLPIGG